MPSTTIAPAPWALSGSGLVMIYHFPYSFNNRWGFLEEYQRMGYKGWLGAVMYMDYKASNVGPYQELLFIPALFKIGGKWSFSIAKIWVSTEDSLINGQRNWGIPKELAQFETKALPQGQQSIRIKKNHHLFFEAVVKPGKLSLPFSTRPLPLTRITQQFEQKLLYTKPEASGKVKLASLQQVWAEESFFPPIHTQKPLLSLWIDRSKLRFPVAESISIHRRKATASR